MGARFDSAVGDVAARVNQQIAEFRRKNPGHDPSESWVARAVEKAGGSLVSALAADMAEPFRVED